MGKRLSALFLLISSILIVGCSHGRHSDDIRIGVIIPLSGEAAIYGKMLQKGLLVAQKEYNNSHNTQVVLLFEDSKAEPKLAVNAINKLISTDNVRFIIGDMFTNTTLAIAPIAQRNNVILLSPTGSSNEISKMGDCIFRIYPSEIEEGKALGQFFNCHFLNEKPFIICANEDAMRNVASSIKQVVDIQFDSEFYNANLITFVPIISKIPLDIRCVFALGYMHDISLFIKQSQELNRNYKVIGLSTLYDGDFAEIISKSSILTYLTAPAFDINSSDENTVDFIQQYCNLFDEQPNVWAGYGYDAFNVLVNAILKSRANNNEVKVEMENTKQYKGVTGITTINKDHSIDKDFEIKQIINGNFVDVN